jgi:hypothetical protein
LLVDDGDAVSWQMTERVLKHSRSKGAARHVLHVLAYHAHDDGTASYPGIGTIVTEANVSRREVFRALQALRDLGEITVSLRPGSATGNLYTITIPVADVTSEVTPSHLVGDKGDTTGDSKSRKPSYSSVTFKEPYSTEVAARGAAASLSLKGTGVRRGSSEVDVVERIAPQDAQLALRKVGRNPRETGADLSRCTVAYIDGYVATHGRSPTRTELTAFRSYWDRP